MTSLPYITGRPKCRRCKEFFAGDDGFCTTCRDPEKARKIKEDKKKRQIHDNLKRLDLKASWNKKPTKVSILTTGILYYYDRNDYTKWINTVCEFANSVATVLIGAGIDVTIKHYDKINGRDFPNANAQKTFDMLPKHEKDRFEHKYLSAGDVGENDLVIDFANALEGTRRIYLGYDNWKLYGIEDILHTTYENGKFLLDFTKKAKKIEQERKLL